MFARIFFGAFVCLALACSKHERIEVRAGPAPLRPVMAAVPLAHASAFDLAPTPDGALVVFVTPDEQLKVVRLSAVGSVVDGPVPIGTGLEGAVVDELVVASGAGRWGAMWVATSRDGVPAVRALSGSLSSLTSVRSHEFGPTVSSNGPRGRLSLFANDAGDLLATFRITPYDCHASEGACARYMHRRLGSDVRTAADVMEVAAPCEPLIAGAAFSRGTWYYSVCSDEPEVAAHVFSLRPEISYAAVHDGAAGCKPASLVPTEDGVWSFSTCARQTRLDVLFADAHTEQRLADVHTELSCDREGTLTLQAFGTSGLGRAASVSTALVGLRTRLEGALPASAASGAARAVWTGRALLVAQPRGRELELRRARCVARTVVWQ